MWSPTEFNPDNTTEVQEHADGVKGSAPVCKGREWNSTQKNSREEWCTGSSEQGCNCGNGDKAAGGSDYGQQQDGFVNALKNGRDAGLLARWL